MKDDNGKGYVLPKLGLSTFIHDYLYKHVDWSKPEIDWKARADLFERQYKELKYSLNKCFIEFGNEYKMRAFDAMLKHHEAERQTLKGNP